jgi:putative ABC transport system permease protein
MMLIATRLEEQYPGTNTGRRVAVTLVREQMVGNVRSTLYLLFGAVGVVLLIVCANTATLLLGKATARTREIAVRAGMGASRLRIVRQLVAESLLPAFVAGALGLALAYGGSSALVKLVPADLPRLGETTVDRWVLAFTLGMSIQVPPADRDVCPGDSVPVDWKNRRKSDKRVRRPPVDEP